MKVLFWVTQFPTVSETFIRNQIVDLINKGVDVLVICQIKQTNDDGLIGFENYNLLDRTVSINDIVPQNKLKRVMVFINLLLKSLFGSNPIYFIKTLNFFKYGKKAISLELFFTAFYIYSSKIDVIHVHFGTEGNKAIFLKEIGIPLRFVITFHGYDIRLGVNSDKSFYSKLFKYCDKVISISNYNSDKLIDFGLNPCKIVSLYNGVEVFDLNFKYFKTESKVTQILSVGRLEQVKSYHLAFKALKIFAEKYKEEKFHYHIIGDGKLREELIELCEELNIEHLITFHLSKSSEFVKRTMMKADVFLLSSIEEALPTVILEAQSLCLPVIATNVGSIKDVVVNNITGFLSDPNEKSLFEAIEKMFLEKEKWNEYGLNARKVIEKEFNRNIQVEKLFLIYKDV